MMILAANLGLDSILYIAAAVWGVISWWRNKDGENAEQDNSAIRQQPEVRRPVAPQQKESDEERMRRFLESLGVPSAPQAPTVRKPQPVRVPEMRKPTPPVNRPRPPAPKPVFIPEPEEMALAGRLEEPASSIEGVGAEFDRMASGVVLPAMAELATRPDVAAFTEVSGDSQAQPTAVTTKSIHAALRSPDMLRTAFVLREVLGPPRSEAV